MAQSDETLEVDMSTQVPNFWKMERKDVVISVEAFSLFLTQSIRSSLTVQQFQNCIMELMNLTYEGSIFTTSPEAQLLSS